MAGITLEIARKHLNEWLEAELACSTNQSYTIGSRTLTRADLTKIGERIKYWAGLVDKLEAEKRFGGRNRARRIMPRDL